LPNSQIQQAIDLLQQCGAAVEANGDSWRVECDTGGEAVNLGSLKVYQGFLQEIAVWDTADCGGHVLDEPTLFVASSRLPKKLESIPRLFEALLRIGVRGGESGEVILNGAKTACEPYCRRLGELFGIEVRDAECFPLAALPWPSREIGQYSCLTLRM